MRSHRFALAGPARAAVVAAAAVALSACQVEVDPAPDAQAAPPAPPAQEEVSVAASTVPPGADLPVRASGFPPNTTVQVGIGQPASEYDVVTEARTDEQGRVDIRVTVPDWTMRGHAYVVVVTESERAPRAVSDPFVVGSPGDAVRVHGTLTDEGVECPALRAPQGTLYTLALTDLEWGPGTDVMVEGTLAGSAICMQGTTIDVESVNRR